jgi:hypothetical protein
VVIVAPPVVAYIWGLLLLASDGLPFFISIGIGFVVVALALVTASVEFLPSHYRKDFRKSDNVPDA